MRYLTVDELIFINGSILNNHKILRGEQKIRERALLEAAAARPMASAFGQDAYPTLSEKAAALLHSVARNHPFTDGNKRTATVGAILMLRVNGKCVNWQQEAALNIILDIAEGRKDLTDFAAWLPVEDCPSALEQDAEQDMQLIQGIVADHAWLLAELDKQ